jgi:type III pantothenate kinase
VILLIDSGNTRIKWRLERQESADVIALGYGLLTDPDPFHALCLPKGERVRSVAVSTVASEQSQRSLVAALKAQFTVPVVCYWSERQRGGLINGYQHPQKMGADRWHGMYAAWQSRHQGFVVVDAGSAMTVDYVAASGHHLGGFILPGLQMMLRSLNSDAARIGFEPGSSVDVHPGLSTSECVNHGLAWLGAALSDQIMKNMHSYGLRDAVLTGGDAERLQRLGLQGRLEPELVLDGLAKIHREQALLKT